MSFIESEAAFRFPTKTHIYLDTKSIINSFSHKIDMYQETSEIIQA